MTSPHTPQSPRLTRRHGLKLAALLGAGAALGVRPVGAATRQVSPPGDHGYAHPEALTETITLKTLMNSDEDLVLVAFMPQEEFATAHIPGSVQIDWPELEVIDTSDASIASWEQAVAEMVGELGITPRSTVVTYDNGTLLSARFWWLLRYLGHDTVAVLNGGLPAWRNVGLPTESGAASVPGGPAYPAASRHELLATGAEVLTAVALAEHGMKTAYGPGGYDLHPEIDPATRAPVIVDARAPEEFAEGHIRGAVNVNFPLNAAAEAPKYFKSADTLRTMYQLAGVTSERQVIPYCASGVRSSVTAFALHLIGFSNVALYTGSWLEWSELPDAPKAGAIATGGPPTSITDACCIG